MIDKVILSPQGFTYHRPIGYWALEDIPKYLTLSRARAEAIGYEPCKYCFATPPLPDCTPVDPQEGGDFVS